MTLREYVSEKLRAFGVTEAQLIDVATAIGHSLETDIAVLSPAKLGTALASALEELILSPKQTSVNENGFSVSWDFSSAGKYYLWLCRKWGIAPSEDALAMVGLSTITDRTEIW